jgi:hypothetical protein
MSFIRLIPSEIERGEVNVKEEEGEIVRGEVQRL